MSILFFLPYQQAYQNSMESDMGVRTNRANWGGTLHRTSDADLGKRDPRELRREKKD